MCILTRRETYVRPADPFDAFKNASTASCCLRWKGRAGSTRRAPALNPDQASTSSPQPAPNRRQKSPEPSARPRHRPKRVALSTESSSVDLASVVVKFRRESNALQSAVLPNKTSDPSKQSLRMKMWGLLDDFLKLQSSQ
ncbi:hypothetical protein BJ508DRAFT_151629 [Ascobolus immersus RN42]|uniref:Uncharacterized protein n=1 Tax=Ascobolus immersus RN42 TaxID=1160509 RepID=A0A3N4HY98_ASCIM|nr:hypothetical protein BJ508DRAFT_151629 [Ascobolus immersus RN42]